MSSLATAMRDSVPRRSRSSFGVALALTALSVGPLATRLPAQEKIDPAAIARIRDEGMQRSQVMETASWLTDVYGARLTNSPNIRNAGEWAVRKLSEWGLAGAKLEPWGPFGRGWTNDYISVHVLTPSVFPVIAYAAAWTPGTAGEVTGEAMTVHIDSDSDFARFRGMLRGKVVLVSPLRVLQPHFTPDGRRLTDEDLERMASAAVPASGGPPMGITPEMMTNIRKMQDFARRRSQFFADEGVLAVLTAGNGDMGTVFTGAAGSRDPQAPTLVPNVIIAAEHYNRILRNLAKQLPVTIALNVKNTFHDGDLNSFNVVAEIPGTDAKLRNEVVMLGAHFDSWHAGTGATDNAAGSAVMMEAVRILEASGLPLRRTVRIGLWTGEEEGLLGSRAYVKEHFGDPETMQLTKEYASFDGYFNLDNGTGKIRGIYLQGDTAAGPIFRQWMAPFDSAGMHTVTAANTGGTDHLAFDAVGLPGWQFIQDGVEYGSRTHHSNMDVWDRLVADDMKHNAVVVAAFVYLAANRDAKLPRKALPQAQKMPVF